MRFNENEIQSLIHQPVIRAAVTCSDQWVAAASVSNPRPLTVAGDPDVILKCIVSGFFANAARIHHSGSYRSEVFQSFLGPGPDLLTPGQKSFLGPGPWTSSHLLCSVFLGLYEMIVNFTFTQTRCFMERNLPNGQFSPRMHLPEQGSPPGGPGPPGSPPGDCSKN